MSGTGAGHSPTKRRLFLLVKVIVGLAIAWMIASKLRLDDEVVLADGTVLAGRRLELDRSSATIVFVDADGSEQRVPLQDDPALLRRDGRTRIQRTHKAAPEDVASARLDGVAFLDVDGERRRIELGSVRLLPGPETDGFVEQLPELREGLATIYRRLTVVRYGTAFLLILGAYLLGIRRWQLLLHGQGIEATFLEATKLTFIGFFFNNVAPGLTGGDIVKAYLVARANQGRGAVAVSTVIVDRVLGLLVLAALSALVLVFKFTAYRDVASWLFLMLGGAAVAICLLLSRRVRRLFRIDALLKRLPKAEALRALDRAFLAYRRQGRVVALAVVLSIGSHLLNILSIYLMGMDLGVDGRAGLEGEPLVTYFAIVPTILIASSVPLLPGGWGLGEALYAYFFRTVGVTNLSLSVGLSVLTRASMLLWSLVGGVFYLMRRSETRAAIAAAEQGEEALPDAAATK